MISRSAKWSATFLLMVNGVTALYGGWSLMIDSTGIDLGLPPEWISRLPFKDYFVPGIMLFVSNGVLSVLSAIATITMRRGYQKFIMFQGCVLMVWILVQIMLLHAIETLHVATAGIGLTLLVLGMILWINRINDETAHYI
jgi:hypothetical protein